MNKVFVSLTIMLLLLIHVSFNSNEAYGEEEQDSIFLQQLQVLQKDLKTLEKAVYSQPDTGMSSSGELSNNSLDSLPKQTQGNHLNNSEPKISLYYKSLNEFIFENCELIAVLF